MKTLYLLVSLLSLSFLFAQNPIDVYGPKPLYQILESDFTRTWAPNADSTIENRIYVVIIDETQ